MENNDLELCKTKDSFVEFIGIPSGDHEAFCWDVTEEEFVKVKGESPGQYDVACGENGERGLFKIYPNDFYGLDNPKTKVSIKIEVIN